MVLGGRPGQRGPRRPGAARAPLPRVRVPPAAAWASLHASLSRTRSPARARASRGTARLRSAAADVSPESHKTGMFCLSFELRVKLCNCSHFLNRSENHAENAFLLGQT